MRSGPEGRIFASELLRHVPVCQPTLIVCFRIFNTLFRLAPKYPPVSAQSPPDSLSFAPAKNRESGHRCGSLSFPLFQASNVLQPASRIGSF